MTTKHQKENPQDNVALYDKLIKTNSEIERKGVKLPYTSVNGHMFTFLSESGMLALRLPKEEREAFLKKYDSALMEAHGAVMNRILETRTCQDTLTF